MIRIGVLGCGYFGAEFARAVEEKENCKLAAVYSPGDGAKRLSEELGCKRAETLEEIMMDGTIDAVIIATPNHLHHSQLLMAAESGKHIFCEKPFALSVKDARDMVLACQSRRVTLMVGHIMHFYSGIEKLKARIDSGYFGKILTMHVERTGWEDKKDFVSWKKMQAKSGGHLFHHIHEIDILQWIMGVPETIYTVGGNIGHQSGGFGDEDDVLLLTASFENKAFATLQYGSGFRMGSHFIRINGERAGAVIDFKQAKVTIADGKEGEMWPLFANEEDIKSIKALFAKTDGGIFYGSPEERPPQYILEALRAEIGLFCRVLEHESVPEDKRDLFDGTSAVNSVWIAEKALASRKSGNVEAF